MVGIKGRRVISFKSQQAFCNIIIIIAGMAKPYTRRKCNINSSCCTCKMVTFLALFAAETHVNLLVNNLLQFLVLDILHCLYKLAAVC